MNTTRRLGVWMAAVLMTGSAVLAAEPTAGNAAGLPKSQPGLAAETPTPEAAPLPAEMASSKLSVQFDPQTQEPRTILNREAKDSLTLVPESAFRLELDKLEGTAVPAELAQQRPSVIVDARDCKIVRAEQQPSAAGGLTRAVIYTSPHGQVAVEYTLGRDDHFLQKRVCFTPAFSESYLLRRVCVQQFRFPEQPGTLISFQHGRCVTHFLRRESTGFFFHVQVPLEVNVEDPAASIALSYDANYRYPAKSPYQAETVFWGVYRRTGTLAPAVPTRIDECRNADVPPDLGESAAMLAMVRRLTDPLREVTVMYEEGVPPGEFRLSRKGYATGGESRAEFEQDKKALSLAQEQFGEFCVLTQVPWGGMAYEMPKLGPDAQEPPASAMQREMIDWCRERNIRLHTWSPMKAVYPWDNGDEGPGVRRFCPNHKPWWGLAGNVEYNCPANREYMAWFTQLLVRLFRRDGYGGYMLDEFLPHPRTGLPCSATGHDHLPGDASYGYFVARRELCQTLRREFGQGFFLEARRPNQDAGVWDALYLDGFFTLSEDRKGGGDEIRYRSRVRHYYHFIPSTMDMHYFRPTPADNLDYLFLSALAVSNRHIVYGLGRDEAERKRIRRWYDWARAHEDLMTRQAIFLPDWPGGGKCDSYFRLNAAGTGYAFVFNANDTPVSTELPLDERCGLVAGREYRVQPEFPDSSDTQVARRSLAVTVPARQVLLLSIQPSP